MLKTKGHAKMLAAVVILSIFSGLAAVGASLMFDLSLWTTLLAYPIGGSIGLLVAAAIASVAPDRAVRAPATVAQLARRP
jgi:hypothetical protein